MTDQQKLDLADALHVAWKRYLSLFGHPPHGTLRQLRALVELIRPEMEKLYAQNGKAQ